VADAAASGTDLSVDVEWTGADAATYARATMTAQAAVIGKGDRRWTSAASAACAVASGAGIFALTMSPLWATVAFFAGLAASVAMQWAYYLDMRDKALVERLITGDPDAYPPRKVVLGQTRISEVSEGMSWHVAMSRIRRVSRSDGLMFIWLSRSDAMAIPERCFATKADGDVFFTEIERRMAEAKPIS
jgi:hypothetical protein